MDCAPASRAGRPASGRPAPGPRSSVGSDRTRPTERPTDRPTLRSSGLSICCALAAAAPAAAARLWRIVIRDMHHLYVRLCIHCVYRRTFRPTPLHSSPRVSGSQRANRGHRARARASERPRFECVLYGTKPNNGTWKNYGIHGDPDFADCFLPPLKSRHGRYF